MAEGLTLGFPPYIQQNTEGGRFGYTGMSPEEAIQQQRINRRQQIANLLIQRGFAQPQGQMVGQFYVPPSPWQHGANLLTLGAGVLGTHKLGAEEKDLQAKHRKQTGEAVQHYAELARAVNRVPGTAYGPGAPVRTVESALPIAQVDAAGNPLMEEGPGGPLHYGTDAPSLTTTPPPPPRDAGDTGMPLAMQSGGYSRGMPDFNAPTPTVRVTEGAYPMAVREESLSPEERRAKVAQILGDATPEASAIIRFMEGMRQHDAEQAAASQEKALDRDLRRQGQIENAATRLATIENTMAMKQMQLAQDERAGIRNDALRRDIQASQEEYKKAQLDLQRWREEEATKTRKEIAAQSNETKKEIAGMQQAEKQEKRQEKRDQMFAEAASQLNASKASTGHMLSTIRELRNHPGLSRITGAMGAVPNFPGSDASNAQALLESLRSQTAARAIADMRAMSKTGGAVGQVTEKEWPRLENMFSALNQAQSTPAFEKALDDLTTYVEGMEGRLNDAFRRQYGDQANEVLGAPAQAQPQQRRGPAVGTVQDGYRFKGGDPSKPESWEKVK